MTFLRNDPTMRLTHFRVDPEAPNCEACYQYYIRLPDTSNHKKSQNATISMASTAEEGAARQQSDEATRHEPKTKKAREEDLANRERQQKRAQDPMEMAKAWVSYIGLTYCVRFVCHP